MSSVAEILISFFLLIGTIMALLGTLGLIRMPDVYNRMHATTMSTTYGTMAAVLAGTIYFSTRHGLTLKLLLVVPLFFWSASAGSFVVARGSHRIGVPMAPVTIRDDLQEDAGIEEPQD